MAQRQKTTAAENPTIFANPSRMRHGSAVMGWIRQFLLPFALKWGAFMSGTLGIPLTVAGIYWPNAPAREIFAISAAAAWMLTAFLMWRHERRQIDILRAQIADLVNEMTPKIRVWFDPDDLGIVAAVERTTLSASPSIVRSEDAMFARIQVALLAGAKGGECSAFLTEVQKRGDDGRITPIRLPQAIALTDGAREIVHGVPFTIDFLKSSSAQNKLNPPVGWPYALENAFDDPGDYIFKIIVNHAGLSVPIRVQISWQCWWDKLTGKQIPV